MRDEKRWHRWVPANELAPAVSGAHTAMYITCILHVQRVGGLMGIPATPRDPRSGASCHGMAIPYSPPNSRKPPLLRGNYRSFLETRNRRGCPRRNRNPDGYIKRFRDWLSNHVSFNSRSTLLPFVSRNFGVDRVTRHCKIKE